MKGVEFSLRYAQREAHWARTDASRLMQARLAFYAPEQIKHQLLFFIEQDAEVVALCSCEASNCGELISLIGMSVDPRFQGQGYCSCLVQAIARFMHDGGYRALCVSRYTRAGLRQLRPCLFKHMQDIEILDDTIAQAA